MAGLPQAQGASLTSSSSTPKRISWGLTSLFEDPISYEVMTDPVLIPCGHSFDRSSISFWLQTKHTCPVCMQPAQASQVVPNYLLKQVIDRYEKKRADMQLRWLPTPPRDDDVQCVDDSSAAAASSSSSDAAASSSSSDVAASSSSSSSPSVATPLSGRFEGQLRFCEVTARQCDLRLIELSPSISSVTYLETEEQWSTIRANPPLASGVHRWECHINRTERGVIMIGVMSPDSPSGRGHYLGESATSWGLLGVNGTLWNAAQKAKFAPQGFRNNTTVGMVLDCERRTLSYDVNGHPLGLAAASLPLPLCFALSFFNPNDRVEVNASSMQRSEETGAAAVLGFHFGYGSMPRALEFVPPTSVRHCGDIDQWHTAKSDVLVADGVHEWTVHVRVSLKGTLLVGLMTPGASPLADGYYIGSDQQSWGMLGINGTLWHGAVKRKYAAGFKTGDTVTLRYNAGAQTVDYAINQKPLGPAFAGVAPPVCFAVSMFHRQDILSVDSYHAAAPPASFVCPPAPWSTMVAVAANQLRHLSPDGWVTVAVAGPQPAAGRLVRQSFRVQHTAKGHIMFGVCAASQPLPDYLGATPFSWGLLGINATFWRAGNKDKTSLPRFGHGDVVTVIVDGVNNTLAYAVNDRPPVVVDSFTCQNCLFAVSLFSSNDAVVLV